MCTCLFTFKIIVPFFFKVLFPAVCIFLFTYKRGFFGVLFLEVKRVFWLCNGCVFVYLRYRKFSLMNFCKEHYFEI